MLGSGSGDREQARSMLDDYSRHNAERLVATWWDLFFHLIAKYRDGYKASARDVFLVFVLIG